MNADGSAKSRLANPLGDSEFPAWSPNGELIAFVSREIGRGNGEIYIVSPDGSGEIRLTNNIADDYQPAWSPDSGQIAFVTKRNGEAGEVYTMNADGSNPIRLTNGTVFANWPLWSPDGMQIVYEINVSSERPSAPKSYIVVISGVGSAQAQLTEGNTASWRP